MRVRAENRHASMWKIIATIGLAFFGYCFLQLVSKWQHQDAIEKAIWFVTIAAGAGWCLLVLFR
jgi:lipid-A-disaccharide synthase-like uncharacterized protein